MRLVSFQAYIESAMSIQRCERDIQRLVRLQDASLDAYNEGIRTGNTWTTKVSAMYLRAIREKLVALEYYPMGGEQS